MLRRKKTKVVALLTAIATLALLFVNYDPEAVGIYRDAGGVCWSARQLTYHFFHANLLHLALNLWCFLSCVFLADVSAGKLTAAYFIASSVPAWQAVPTVGLSGVCFALLGLVMWQSHNKMYCNVCVIASIALPELLLHGHVNSALHAYCYSVAVIMGGLQKLCFYKRHHDGIWRTTTTGSR